MARGGELLLRPEPLPGAARARSTARTRSSASRSTSATRCSAGCATGCRTSRSVAPASSWGIPFPGDPDAPHLRLVRRADQLRHRGRLPRRSAALRALLARGRARHRQEHHPLPLPLLAGDADERRAGASAPGLRPRLHAAARREDVQDARQRARSGRGDGAVRGRRRALPGPARDPVRSRRGRDDRGARAPLQRRPGQRPRQLRQPHGEHGRPLPGRRAAGAGRRPADGRPRAAGCRARRRSATTTPPWAASTSTRRWRR